MTNHERGAAVDRFYYETLNTLIKAGRIDPTLRTLVVCGGDLDKRTLQSLGFTDVTISNLDSRIKGNPFQPYAWAFQDVESLDYEDGAFDQVIEHNGLHHCASPHRALTEMYRVCAKSLIAIEPRDSICVRLACRLQLAWEYEIEAVLDNDRCFGGLRNTAVPNFVYRWTEREVEKTLATFDPTGPVNAVYFHGVALPVLGKSQFRTAFKTLALAAAKLPAKAVLATFPKQGNRFGFWIGKPKNRHVWLAGSLDGIDPTWPRLSSKA